MGEDHKPDDDNSPKSPPPPPGLREPLDRPDKLRKYFRNLADLAPADFMARLPSEIAWLARHYIGLNHAVQGLRGVALMLDLPLETRRDIERQLAAVYAKRDAARVERVKRGEEASQCAAKREE